MGRKISGKCYIYSMKVLINNIIKFMDVRWRNPGEWLKCSRVLDKQVGPGNLHLVLSRSRIGIVTITDLDVANTVISP